MRTDEPLRPQLNGLNTVKSFWRHPLLRLVILVLFIECVIFQWPALVPTPEGGQVTIPAASQILEGFTRDSAWPQLLKADESQLHAITIPLSGQSGPISLSGQSVRSIFLDAYSNKPGPLTYQVSVIDLASSVPYLLAEGQVVGGVDRSRTLLVWPSGPVISIRITFLMQSGQQLHLNRLILNRPIAFRPSLFRMLLLIILGMLFHALFASSIFLRKAAVNDFDQRLIIFSLGFIIFITGAWLTILAAPQPFFSVSTTNGDLYSKHLTDALLQGRFDLPVSPPAALAALANPYDPAQRAVLSPDSILWDAAYFDGRYYVPYGIVPALLFFMPFKALSGYYFQTAWAVLLFGAFGMILLLRVLRRFLFALFPDLAFRYHVVLCMVVPAMSFVAWGLARPKFYELAILSGFFFLMLGLDQLSAVVFSRSSRPARTLFEEAANATQGGNQAFEAAEPFCRAKTIITTDSFAYDDSLKSDDSFEDGDRPQSVSPNVTPDRLSNHKSNRISVSHLFFACLFFTISVGCHPLLMVTFVPLTAVLLFLIIKSRQTGQTREVIFFSAAPVLLVAYLLAFYNNTRFGSYFEFGTRFQLTITDMQARGFWAPERLIPGIGHYLLTPPIINTIFPFVHFQAGRVFSYSGFMITDGRTVGLLSFPFMTILLVWPFVKRALKKASHAIRWIFAVSLATALLLLAAISMTAGGVGRYTIDIALWLMVPAMLVWLLLIEGAEKHGLSKWHFNAFLTASVITLFLCLMIFLQGENDRIEMQAPYFYELLRRTLSFWLP